MTHDLTEPILVLASLRDRETYQRIGGILGEDFFLGDLAHIRKAIELFWQQNTVDKVAPVYALRMLLQKTSRGKWSTLEPVFKRVIDAPIHPSRAIQQHLREYINRQALRRLALEIADAVDRKGKPVEPTVYQTRLRQLAAAGDAAHERGVDYSTAPVEYFTELDRGRVPTGIPSLDRELKGGLGRGHLGLVIAPYSGGKTTALINLGAGALEAGKRVLHLSLEINRLEVLMRYDMRLGRTTTKELVLPGAISRIRKQVLAKGGKLSIHDLSHTRFTPQMLQNMIELENEKPELVVIDYADNMYADQSADQSRFQTTDIYKEIRRLASLFDVPIWTASQANRGASQSGVFTGADVADDINKMRIVDFGVCLQQTIIQKGQGRMTLFMDKTRADAHNPSLEVRVDYNRMLIHDEFSEEDHATEDGASAENRPRKTFAGAKNRGGVVHY